MAFKCLSDSNNFCLRVKCLSDSNNFVSVCIAVTRYMFFRVLNAAAQPLLTLDDLQMIIQQKEQESLILIEVNMTTMKNSIRNCNLLNSSADLD